MNKDLSRKKIAWLLPGLALGLSILACTLGGGATDTPAAPAATNTPPGGGLQKTTSTPKADQTDVPSTPPPSTGRLRLASSPYTHPSGAFRLTPPDGWEVDAGDASTTFTAPDETGRIDVYLNTTGYELDDEAVGRFIAANETNYFAVEFDGYEVVSATTDDFGAYVSTQSLDWGGIPSQVTSIYYRQADVIFEIDFWVENELIDAYQPTYQEIWNEMELDASGAAGVEPYYFVYTFNDSDGYFSFEVPYGWIYEQTSGNNSVVDKFVAPDERAFVDNIKYDEGTEISKSLAGEIALELLRQFYADDIQITEDKVQPDGSERLTWFSESGQYSGISFFETRGTVFLMLTFVANDDVYDLYSPIFDNLLDTYDVP
ncbi:MAG TPA: hypothetical protein VJ123_01390 [Anaerolineales bacterium]|nr:hypothetical protein [Anaerolineales bacterium]